MTLTHTRSAIGQVSSLLREQLNSRTGLSITIGRTDPPPNSAALNIFLYEVVHDGSMRNIPIDHDRPAPLWLVLKFLLTAFDDDGSSDSIDAHEYLGRGMAALSELAFLLLNDNTDAATRQALEDNPEPLKITFDQASPDLIGQIMQGSDEKYRCSAAFQIRPILIAPDAPVSYAPRVGVDLTQNGQAIESGSAINPILIPGLGPVLNAVEPASFVEGQTITLTGLDLQLAHSLYLGDQEIPITMQRPDQIQALVNTGSQLSPGLHQLQARQNLPDQRYINSNPLAASLLPQLQSAAVNGDLTLIDGLLTGNIDLSGTQLGTNEDQRFAALIDANNQSWLSDNLNSPDTDQTSAQFALTAPGLPPGTYRVALKVNGVQALNMPHITLETP